MSARPLASVAAAPPSWGSIGAPLVENTTRAGGLQGRRRGCYARVGLAVLFGDHRQVDEHTLNAVVGPGQVVDGVVSGGHHVRIVDWPLTEGCAAFHAVITGSTSDHCSLDRSVL